MNGWERQWHRFGGKCPYCRATHGEPCRDQRWEGRHYRACLKPHPERKHVRLVVKCKHLRAAQATPRKNARSSKPQHHH